MKSTVLVVDDDAKFLTFVERTLTRAGFQVITASDGCDVPEMLAHVAVDVVVTDLQMPGMNGWELLRTLHSGSCSLRTGPAAQPPKLVVLSGRDEEETSAFVRRLGADACLSKPVLGEQIVTTVRDLLKP